MGSLWGLLMYLITLPFWWLVLKSPTQGAQGYLRAAMEAELARGAGGRLLKECREIEYKRLEVKDESVQKKLWEFSDKQVEALEKESAVKRALAKKEKEEAEKASKETAKVEEVEAGGEERKSERKQGSRRSKKSAS